MHFRNRASAQAFALPFSSSPRPGLQRRLCRYDELSHNYALNNINSTRKAWLASLNLLRSVLGSFSFMAVFVRINLTRAYFSVLRSLKLFRGSYAEIMTRRCPGLSLTS